MTDIKKSPKPEYRYKYDSKYFGTATGFLSVILFLLIIFNSFFSNANIVELIKPFIPFWNNISLLNISAGVFIVFMWGWLLGYLFMIFYTWFDNKFNKMSI